MKTVLTVDDEDKIREVVVSYLQRSGFRTLEASTGAEALDVLRRTPVDFVILDLMLPDIPGEEVCRKIRSMSSVPVLMLTAKSATAARIHGLNVGADDYMVKPFDPLELVARVRAVLRRTDETMPLAARLSFNDGELVVDAVRDAVFLHGRPVRLTPTEYRLLLLLARHPERTFNRDELAEKALGPDFDGADVAVDQHIKNLRQKIEPDPKQPTYIRTVYGIGYRFTGGSR